MPGRVHTEIQNINFDTDGAVHIAYYIPDQDVKAPGVAHLHTLMIPKGFDYDDEITALLDAAEYLILDVLEDFEALPSAFEGISAPPETT
jgi:hypothetical protein